MQKLQFLVTLLMIYPLVSHGAEPMRAAIQTPGASKMKTILCYGDSNSWGFIPGSYNKQTCLGKRYPKNKRWTGILQNLLGESCNVIEEAINGRTTIFDETIPGRPYRNGLTYLPVSLESHYPIDLVILMLGINDMKIQYNQSAQESAEGIRQLIKIVKTCNKGPGGRAPQILLVAPQPLVESSTMQDQYDAASIKKSKELGNAYQQVANQEECAFLDVSLIVSSSTIDGVHLDEQQAEILGQALAKKVTELIQLNKSWESLCQLMY